MTSMMFRKCLTAVAIAALVGVVALAPVTSAEASGEGSPFAGSWSGTWSAFDVAVVGTGTYDWTISDAGRLSGRLNITGADSGAIVGHVGADGNLKFIGFTPADDPLLGNGVPFRGTASIDGSGKLVVSAKRADSNLSIVATLDRN